MMKLITNHQITIVIMSNKQFIILQESIYCSNMKIFKHLRFKLEY